MDEKGEGGGSTAITASHHAIVDESNQHQHHRSLHQGTAAAAASAPSSPNNNNNRSASNMKLEFCNNSLATSTPSLCTRTLVGRHEKWCDNSTARNYFVSLLTLIYAILIVIIAFGVELSQKLRDELWLTDLLFFVYMYTAGLLFILYCYLFMLHPKWVEHLQRALRRLGLLRNQALWTIRKSSHAGEGAGSFYLRLGAVVFGTVGTVLFGIELVYCMTSKSCYRYQMAKLVLPAVFVFCEMHFIYANSKICIAGSRPLAKLGTAHLVAVNLWTWFRFVMAKHAAKAAKLSRFTDAPPSDVMRDATVTIATSTTTTTLLPWLRIRPVVAEHRYLRVVRDYYETTAMPDADDRHAEGLSFPGQLYSMALLGDSATILITCIVEFSLIGAAVMFVLWRSMDKPHGGELNGADPRQQQQQHQQHNSNDASSFSHIRRKHRLRVDCSSSSTGLFAGLLFLIGASVSIGLHSVFDQLRDVQATTLVFAVVDFAMFSVCLLASLLALWRMRLLQYVQGGSHSNGETIDEILLVFAYLVSTSPMMQVIGLIGELAYCTTGVDAFISGRYAMPCYVLGVYVVRLLQVVIQALFILTSSRLRSFSPLALERKPGKQLVTFLLVANCTLFFFHIFEGMKSSGLGYDTAATAPHTVCSIVQSHLLISYIVSPLIVFYRFHSSVCLAEIWKHSYNTKSLGDAPSHTPSISLETVPSSSQPCSACVCAVSASTAPIV